MQRKKIIAVAAIFVLILITIISVFVWNIHMQNVKKMLPLPFNITVSFGNNVLTDKNFCWYTNSSGEAGYIQYTEDIGQGFDKEKCITTKAFSERVKGLYPVKKILNTEFPEMEEIDYVRHRAYLTNLKTGTTYLYRVGQMHGEYFSDVYTFKTPKEKDEAEILLFADSQGFFKSDYDYYSKVLKIANINYPDTDFSVHMGDFVEDGRNELQWEFALPKNIMANNTFIPVAGNKDDKSVYNYFTLGSEYDSTAMTNGWMSFDYGSVHFVVLYTGSNGDLSKKQKKWLEEDLSKKSQDRTIVLIHKAPYTNANHADDNEIVALKKQLLPIFDKYNVDIVLQAHDHFYFRSEPIFNNAKGECTVREEVIEGDKTEIISDIKGTVYLINSSSGIKQYDKVFRDIDGVYDRISFNCKRPTFTFCKITEDTVIFKTYEVNISSQSVNIIDSFGLSS